MKQIPGDNGGLGDNVPAVDRLSHSQPSVSHSIGPSHALRIECRRQSHAIKRPRKRVSRLITRNEPMGLPRRPQLRVSEEELNTLSRPRTMSTCTRAIIVKKGGKFRYSLQFIGITAISYGVITPYHCISTCHEEGSMSTGPCHQRWLPTCANVIERIGMRTDLPLRRRPGSRPAVASVLPGCRRPPDDISADPADLRPQNWRRCRQ